MMYAFKHLEKFTAFVIERHAIWRRRFMHGQSAPWTKDKILMQYRFCNVYRELDRVTQWITRQWRTPYEEHPDLWFAMVVARLVNYPQTLAELSLPGRWNKAQFIRVLHARRASGEKTFGSAYIVSTNGIARDKAEYLANMVLDPMWDMRERLRPVANESLEEFYRQLRVCQGMGSFMAAQIVADIKYVPPLRTARDWWTFAASGPGSRKGMAYVLGYSPDMRWREHEWKEALMELSELTRPIFADAKLPRIHNQDLQNCLCEFSKYRRTQLKTGKPKQNFTPYDGDE